MKNPFSGGGGGSRDNYTGGVGGAMLGNAAMGPGGAVVGGLMGYNSGGGGLADKMGWGSNAKQKDAEARERAAREGSYNAGKTANSNIKLSEDLYRSEQRFRDEGYLSDARSSNDKLLADIETLKGQAQDQAKNAGTTYTDTILPQYKSMMERSAKEGQGAMTLAEAGNVNNQVHKDVRGLYESQAQGVGRQGLADAGVLASLGAQASAGQMGGVPMTGGQMSAIQGQNQAQSGMAYSRAQQQMQNLRDQGLNRGFEESAAQYERGQGALDRWGKDVGAYEGANQRNWDTQRGFRGEIGGMAHDIQGTQQGMNNLDYGVRSGTSQMGLQMDTAQQNRTLANEQGYYGGQGAQAAGEAAAAGANQAGKINTWGGIAQQAASAAMTGGMSAAAGGGGASLTGPSPQPQQQQAQPAAATGYQGGSYNPYAYDNQQHGYGYGTYAT